MSDDPSEGSARADELVALRSLVVEHGGDERAADEADDPYHLAALVFDAVLTPDTDRYALDEVAALAEVDRSLGERLWRAMGFPDPADGEPLAGEMDVTALRLAASQMTDASGVDNGVRQTRIYAAAVSRITELWVDELRNALDSGLSVVDATAAALPMLDLERTGELLGYVHRRLLAAGLRRELASRSTGEQAPRAVAFADLVGFTTLTERIGPLELSKVIESFEALAYDTVAVHGGRVVKTIGDEVLYTSEDPGTVLTISTTLLDDSGPLGLPELRIGIDCGMAVWYEGDLYGPAVNRAARIVAEADPGTVVASRSFAEETTDHGWAEHGARDLKGIGPVELLRLSRD